jgi:3-hydroxybutyryl-CoA dehydrogenase
MREDEMEKIGVVGAGLMGSEIALVFALAGHRVTVVDARAEALENAKSRLAGVLDKGIARGFYQPENKESALANLTFTLEIEALADCDLVTEAVFEDQAVKADVLRRLDAVCKPECVLATNTSTIPISTLASYVSESRRERFIGTHYFSPVSRMKLVEVVPAFGTNEATVEFATRLCQAIGKVPIRVKDVAGFAVNRVLHAFVIEAIRLVEEGVATPEDIDTACKLGLGHPIGPFELMDVTTSSLCLQVQEILHENYGERFRPRPLLKQRVRAGLIGGRSAPGWRGKKS